MGDQPSTTTQIQKVELPPWVDQAGQDNYAAAQAIAAKPYTPYTGETVAPLGQGTNDAINLANNSAGQYNGDYSSAATALQGLLGQAAPTANGVGPVTAGSIANTDLSKYLNPYTDDVINKSLGDMDIARQQALNTNASKATAASSFGGSRAGVVDALTNSESIRNAGTMAAGLRQSAFDTATGLATGDLNRDLTAQTTNASNSLATNLANLGAATSDNTNKLGAASQLTNTATAGQASNLADISSLLNVGNIQQTQQQKQDTDAQAKFTDAQNYDLNNLNLLLTSLGMSPYGKTSTSTTTKDDGGGSDWATAALGGLSLLKGASGLGLFSEDTEKEDIQKVGRIPGSKLDAYAYRYKGDPKSYPKVVGLMASNVEEHVPEAIKRIGKKRIVNYDMVLRAG